MDINSTNINIYNFEYGNRDYRIFAIDRFNDNGEIMFTSNTIFNVLDSEDIARYVDFYDDVAFVSFTNGKNKSYDLITYSTVKKYMNIIREEDNRDFVKDFLNAFTKFIDEVIYPSILNMPEFKEN